MWPVASRDGESLCGTVLALHYSSLLTDTFSFSSPDAKVITSSAT